MYVYISVCVCVSIEDVNILEKYIILSLKEKKSLKWYIIIISLYNLQVITNIL